MPRLSRSILANLGGTAGALIVTLACTPSMVRWLGMEAYGLMGFCILLQTLLSSLQFGSPAVLQRALSTADRNQTFTSEARSLVLTLEAVSWGTAALIAAALALLLPWLAAAWLECSLAPQVLVPAMFWMSLVVALQWPTSLYHAGLVGLERSDQANAVIFVVTLVRSAGGLGVLWAWGPNLAYYAAWQAGGMLLHIAILRWRLDRELPAGVGRFAWGLLRQHAGFAAGITGNALTGLFVSQLDKLVLVTFLSLEDFGCYVLASALTTLLPRLSAPVTLAASPRLSRLAAAGDQVAFGSIYHQTSELLAVLLLPLTVLVAAFPCELLWVWTGDGQTVARTAPLVQLLFVSAALTSMMNLPYCAQIAHRWTSLSLGLNLASLVLGAPLQAASALYFGPLGVGCASLLNSAGRLVAGTWWMHRRILPGELRRWLLHDLGRPLTAACAVAALARWSLPLPAQRLELLGCLALLGATMLAAAVATTSLPSWLRSRIRGLPPPVLQRHSQPLDKTSSCQQR